MEHEFQQSAAIQSAQREQGAISGYASKLGGSVFAQQASPDRTLPAMRDRIIQMNERAASLSERLEAVGDRVFGSFPVNNAKSEARAVRSGDIGSIDDALENLSGLIARAHDAMTRLESL